MIGTGAALAALHWWGTRRRPSWEPGRGAEGRAGPLWVRTLGDGPPILLLHGLLGSGRFWGGSYDSLADRHRLIVPDLLGFGRSDRPAHGYGPDDHAMAVASALDDLGVDEPVTIGAHSLGGVIALRLAILRPGCVASIVAFGPPLYADAPGARLHVAASSPMAKLFVLPGPAAETACRWVCDHPRTAAAVARTTHPSLPPEVAEDAILHTWHSYSETLERCLLEPEQATSIPDVDAAVLAVAGCSDRVVDRSYLDDLARRNPGLTVRTWCGDHRLPLTHSDRCRSAILAAASWDGNGNLPPGW